MKTQFFKRRNLPIIQLKHYLCKKIRSFMEQNAIPLFSSAMKEREIVKPNSEKRHMINP